MRTSRWLLVAALFAPLSLLAQTPPAPGGGPDGPLRHGHGPGRHEGMGKWWKNSDLAKKLNLTDQQIKQLDSVFYEHRLKLIDYQAEVEKQDLKLQTLLDQDSPNESEVGSQVDQVLGARGKLEREFTMMNLALRKVLTVEQWKQLKDLHGEHGPIGGGPRHMGHGPRPPQSPAPQADADGPATPDAPSAPPETAQ